MTALAGAVSVNPVYDLLADLATCLCAQIAADGSPPTCTCGVVPGEVVALDHAGDCDDTCGMAWVRMASIYPAVQIGVPDTSPGNCGSGLGLDIEIGVVRCIGAGDAQGNPPPPEDLLAATMLATADAQSMFRAVLCCTSIERMGCIVGQYTPYGPEGGMVGGTLAVQVTF